MPSLQLFGRVCKGREPVLVQAFGPEPTETDKTQVRGLARAVKTLEATPASLTSCQYDLVAVLRIKDLVSAALY